MSSEDRYSERGEGWLYLPGYSSSRRRVFPPPAVVAYHPDRPLLEAAAYSPDTVPNFVRYDLEHARTTSTSPSGTSGPSESFTTRLEPDLFSSEYYTWSQDLIVFIEAAPRIRSFSSKLRNVATDGTTKVDKMNYQNYLESPQGSGGNTRQAPSPNQGMNHTNGINGNAVGLPGIVAGLPTPAGHQSDLNHIYNMVEELSRTLEENRQATARIVAASGQVRQRAMEQNMTNEEVIASVAEELNSKALSVDDPSRNNESNANTSHCLESTRNLEVENAGLKKKLDAAENEGKENLAIAFDYAKSMSNMLEQIHAFKIKTIEDMSAWHHSYRNQLEHEREENLKLRCHISDMQASAARGAEALRDFRRDWDGSPAYFAWMSEHTYLKQMCRSWKRMALSNLPDDDSEFSDDDDMIDPEEKKRLAREEIARIEKKHADRAAIADDAAAAAADSS
ncbi:MAG: hypothetical protein M1818_004123 [Claussenomyces sp. TS43310]|nr:MAG: hypothetical protein M1818_004123 [Claussenomyces sp. TS43310]